MKNYSNIVKQLGYTEYDYQKEFLGKPDFYEPSLPLLLAFDTGGGKTTTALIKLDIYYSNPANKGKRTVIFPHATNVLRNNFADALNDYGDVSFSSCVIENSDQIEDVFNSDCEVIIVLPQTVRKHLSKLGKVDWMIVDEAHEWYFAPAYQRIKDALRPEYIMLMTGTPSKFNNKPDEFLYYHVSYEMLHKEGQVGNARVEIVSSNYEMQNDDILKSGNVHSRVANNVNKSVKSLETVCKQMLRTLNNPTNNRLKVVNNVLGEVFNTLEQTIIFCNSQAQAKQFYKSLNKALPGKVLISISEDGGASEEFDTFKSNPEYKVLLLVRKGRLGFSMKELYNIVDFTLSTNVDVISQMLGRVLRVGKKDKMKYYFKVSPQNTVWYFEAIMKIVLRNKMQDVFSTYDGNQNNVKLPKDKKRKPRKPMSKRAPNNERTPNFSEIDSDIISNIEFFKQVYHKGGQAFQTVSWTTLDDVRKECFNLRDRRTGDKVITYDECLQVVKERGYTRKIEFQTMNPAHYAFIQTNGLMDKFVKDAGLKGRKLVLTYEEVKACADQCTSRRDFNLKFQSKYKKALRMGWLSEWFPEIQKSGPKEGSKNFKLNK